MKTETDYAATAVLLAEDNPVNQEVAVAMLELLGYAVDLVENGDQALKAFLKKPYRLICMDCHMPVMDGKEATRRIRQHEGSQAGAVRTPIVALTANASVVEYDEYMASGMDAVIAKPFGLVELSTVLSAFAPTAKAYV